MDSTRRRRRGASWWLAGLASLACSARARAQGSPAEEARELLLAQAQTAHTQGDHETALRLGLQAIEVRTTPSLLYFAAREHSELGQYARAFRRARNCVRSAEGDAGLRNRQQLIETCRGLADAAFARIGSVQMGLPATLPTGLRVLVAGELVADGALRLPIALDPGRVTIQATAPGHRVFERTVDVTTGQMLTLPVELLADGVAPVREPSRGAAPVALLVTGGVLTAAGVAMLTAGLVTRSPEGCRVATVGNYDLLCPDGARVSQAVASDWLMTLAPAVGAVGVGLLAVGAVLRVLPVRAPVRASVAPWGAGAFGRVEVRF